MGGVFYARKLSVDCTAWFQHLNHKVFSTAADNQPAVDIPFFKERPMAADNKTIGRQWLIIKLHLVVSTNQRELHLTSARTVSYLKAKDLGTQKEQTIVTEAAHEKRTKTRCA